MLKYPLRLAPYALGLIYIWRMCKLTNVYDILEERGFIEQSTEAAACRQLLENPSTCYIGFDPTASSLHVGSLLPLMLLRRL